jgi:hypothetical protein
LFFVSASWADTLTLAAGTNTTGNKFKQDLATIADILVLNN